MPQAEKFYFVRHGQTEANLSELAAGSGWDIELNEAGHSQARELAESSSMQICREVKTICCSPMIRAVQTAEALNKILNVPIVKIDDLKEWHLGEWERKSWRDLPDLHAPDSNPPGGESKMEFGMRISGALQQCLKQDGPVLIVAHGGVWHAIARILSLASTDIGNCELKVVTKESESGKWVAVINN